MSQDLMNNLHCFSTIHKMQNAIAAMCHAFEPPSVHVHKQVLAFKNSQERTKWVSHDENTVPASNNYSITIRWLMPNRIAYITLSGLIVVSNVKIGRASCRERVF